MAQGTQVCHCEAPTGPWQSHAGSCDFADGFPVVRPCSARLPRRFAPRNDTSGAFTIITIGCSDRQHCAGAGCPLPYNGVCGRRQCAQICCCQRRSLTAATDAIGAYRFHGGRYGSAALRREGTARPLQWRVQSPRVPGNLQLPKAVTTRKGYAASVRRQSRQRLRSERRYRRNWFLRFFDALYELSLPSRDCHGREAPSQ